MRYFSSDFHFGSTNINKYANRPFSSAEDALASLLCNINGSLSRHDTLIHNGDFLLSGADRHDTIEDNGLKFKLNDYLDMIEPNVFLVEGNHDSSNCESDAKCLLIDLNQNYRNVTVAHVPSYHQYYLGKKGGKWIDRKFVFNKKPHVHLCGHVHDKFLICYDDVANVLNYNVGVDVHDYKPVRDAEITADLDFIFNAKVKMPKNTLTLHEFRLWKKLNDEVIASGREERKAEKLLKKGLTPEMCEQRKIEAMKKKGLIK